METNDEFNELPEGYLKHLANNKKLIEDLAKEELIDDKVDSVESIRRKIKGDTRNTDRVKNQFVEEIKSGLGEKIKSNPNATEHIKKPKTPFMVKIKKAIKRLFNTI